MSKLPGAALGYEGEWLKIIPMSDGITKEDVLEILGAGIIWYDADAHAFIEVMQPVNNVQIDQIEFFRMSK